MKNLMVDQILAQIAALRERQQSDEREIHRLETQLVLYVKTD